MVQLTILYFCLPTLLMAAPVEDGLKQQLNPALLRSQETYWNLLNAVGLRLLMIEARDWILHAIGAGNRPLRRLNSLGGDAFGLQKRAFDSLSGSTFGAQKRNFDEIDNAGFGAFVKRNFDEIDNVGMGFKKRNFDEIDNAGFGAFLKRSI